MGKGASCSAACAASWCVTREQPVSFVFGKMRMGRGKRLHCSAAGEYFFDRPADETRAVTVSCWGPVAGELCRLADEPRKQLHSFAILQLVDSGMYDAADGAETHLLHHLVAGELCIGRSADKTRRATASCCRLEAGELRGVRRW